jgi:hypothetical protein
MRDERWRRVLWFVGLWVGGVVALTIVAGVLRLAMSAAGY